MKNPTTATTNSNKLKIPCYRAGVGGILLNSEKKILVAQRSDFPDVWQLPQGGVDSGENLTQALQRELYEEIGITDCKIMHQLPPLSYNFPDDLRQHHSHLASYLGQTINWFVIQFNGADSHINLNTQEKPEFLAWKWIDIPHILQLKTGFKKSMYLQIHNFLSNLISI